MHNKLKTNTDLPQTMGSTLNNKVTTRNTIISSTFDEVSHTFMPSKRKAGAK